MATTDYYELRQFHELNARLRAKNPDALTPIVGTENSWWRPGELLVHVNARGPLDELLKRAEASPLTPEDERSWRNRYNRRADPNLNDSLREASGFELYVTRRDVDLQEVVAEGRRDLDRNESISVNTVVFGEPYYMGGPGSVVKRADAPKTLPTARGGGEREERRIDLTVLDTGLPFDWRQEPYRLSEFVRDSDVISPDEMDLLDADGNGLLDHEAAHGLFICGLANRLAPELRIDPGLVLNPLGAGDEAGIIHGLTRADSPVINLSLGGYSEDGEPPPAMENAVRWTMKQDKVIVAAAGNDYGDEEKRRFRFWPAAIEGVIGVGAFDSRTGELADFSNRGDWVTVFAPGVDLISDFVRGWPVPSTRTGGIWDTLARRFPHLFRRHFEGWAQWSGTSFATPLVAAQIAALVAADPGTPARETADTFLAGLPAGPWPGESGKIFDPGDFTT